MRLFKKKAKKDTESSEESDDSDLGGGAVAAVAAPKIRGSLFSPKRQIIHKKRSSKKGSDSDSDEMPAPKIDKKSKKEQKRIKKLEDRVDEESGNKEKRSIKWLQATELAIRMDKEDMSSKVGISSDGIASFISVPILTSEPLVTEAITSQTQITSLNAVFETSSDYCQGRVLVPKRGARGKAGFQQWREEIYMENPASGRFKRHLLDLTDTGERLLENSDGHHDKMNSVFTPEKLRATVDQLEWGLEGLFMIGQGALCGASLFQLIVVFQVVSEHEVFLSIYAPLCKEIRRVFFFLSVLALVAACDKLASERQDSSMWLRRNPCERAELWAYVGFYTCNLVSTLCAYRSIDEIYGYFLLYDNPISTDLILPSRSLDQSLTIWKVFICTRFAFAALGWILLCKDIQRDLLRGRRRIVEVVQCKDTIKRSLEKISKLAGKGLQQAPLEELKVLQQILNTGSTEVQLQMRLRGVK